MANRTVKDFEFPASFGFTGSGGMTPVKGYMRGGSVAPKKGPEARLKSPPPDIGWADYKKGGKVKKGGKPHDDKVMDLKLIRSEISKAKGVPAFKSEPMIPMKKGGKACK